MSEYHFDPELRKALEKLPVPIGIYQKVDNEQKAILVTNGFCNLINMSRSDAMKLMSSRDFLRYTEKDDLKRVHQQIDEYLDDKPSYDIIYSSSTSTSGEYNIVHAHGDKLITKDGTTLYIVYYLDETNQELSKQIDEELDPETLKSLHDEMPSLAEYYDYLTGLPTMSYFLELAAASTKSILKKGQEPVLLAFNLTGMKNFNSTYGVSAGDELLRSFASVLKESFTNEGCARFGDDYFTAITDKAHVSGQIKEIINKTDLINNGQTLPVRIGIFPYSEGEDISVSSACDRAKIACDYNSNAYISHYTYFNESMLKTVNDNNYIIDNLDTALKENWIQAYYQPIIRSISGKVANEEALARWIDSQKGMLSPAEFIPVLEHTKLLYKVDLHMVDSIIADFIKKKEAGLDIVPVSVNLSRYDFEACDMVSEIVSRVKKANVDPHFLIIEITESVIGLGKEFLKDKIDRFHKAGFKVWMDDFGSGYSSLEILEDFNFDLIKLDMDFLKDFDENPKSRLIVKELIELARDLKVDTLCEGVETKEEFDFLRTKGCDRIQGFYFSKPLSLPELLKFEMPREKAEEFDYYQKISTFSLSLPEVPHVTNENHMAVVFFEFHPDRSVHMLRMDSRNSRLFTEILTINKQGVIRLRDPKYKDQLVKLADSARKTLDWNSIKLHGDNFVMNLMVKKLGDNPVTGAEGYALGAMSVDFKGSEE